MGQVVIKAEGLSKKYRLGVISHGTLREDLQSWWAKIRGQEDPNISMDTITTNEEFWALKDLSFEINQGDVIGVIGRNGAGKSTLLKILSRVTTPTEGIIKVKGRIASLLEVGTGFHPELTGRENIYLNGAILGMSKQEINRKFDEIVAFAEIEKFVDTPAKRYSSGMYVRLAFAVAAHLEPEILIVDEVLAVGDVQFQKKSLGKMEQVGKEGRTVLFVGHNMGMIRSLCQKAMTLKQGKLVDFGSSQEVVDRYVNTLNEEISINSAVEFELNKDLAGQILKAKILGEDKKMKTSFDVFESIWLEIEYVLREELKGTAIKAVVERNGEVLFNSFDTDTQDYLLNERSPGIYRALLKLPCPLKAGNYVVSLGIEKLNVGDIDLQKNCLKFDVEELTFDPTLRSYYTNRIGVMAAHINWENQCIENF